MKAARVFGLVIPERHGGAGVSTACFALVTEELARGWMSLAGAMGGHSVVARLITMSGTDEQKDTWLPRMATGQVRAAMARPSCRRLRPAGHPDQGHPAEGGYRLDGVKTWITNARAADMIAVLCKTDPEAVPGSRGNQHPAHREGAGLHRLPRPAQLGYKGVETCELVFDGLPVPGRCAARRAGGRRVRPEMDGLELGRIQVAARAVGVARAALEDCCGTRSSGDVRASRSGDIRRSATGCRHGHPVEAGTLLTTRAPRARHRAAQRPGGGDGETVRVRGLPAGHRRRDQGARGLTGIRPSSTSSATTASAADGGREGNQRHPAQRHHPQLVGR